MSKIRVCNVLEEGRFGGPQRRVLQVAKALNSYNIDTHVVYSKYDSEKLSQELSQAAISNSAINITRLTREKKMLARYFVCFFTEIIRLFTLFRREKFDLVHVNGSYQFKGAIAGKLAGIPVVWHLNDTSMMPVLKKLCVIISRYCAVGFIVAGNRVYHYYYLDGASLEQKPCIEIHAPVDTTVFDPRRVVGNSRVDEYDGVKVLTVSNINPTKGLKYFVEMASILALRHENLIFFIAGSVLRSQEKYYQNLKRLVTSNKLMSNFLFLGKVDNVPSVLKGADVCVFTSLSEASPTAIWEAMSMGKPIVTTDVGSVNQYIEDGKSGFIVPVKDSKALAEKVEILIKNPTLRQKMGAEARRVAKEKLDVSIAAEKHALFYRKILEMQRNRTGTA